MTDLDELIAEARHEESIQDKLGDGFSEGSEERAFYYEHRDRYGRLADALEAATSERDAAVAAVERVQDTLSLHNPNGRLVKEVLAALDGAPEPAWEYGVEVVGDVAIRKREIVERACASTDYATLVRRRPAGPWIPVAGEKP